MGSGATLAAGQYKAVTTPAALALSVYTGESVATATITLSILLKGGTFPEVYNNI